MPYHLKNKDILFTPMNCIHYIVLSLQNIVPNTDTTGSLNFEVSHPRCVDQLSNQRNILNIWSEHKCILLSHRLVHTTTCFGPVYWPLSGCIINLISSYTIYAWVPWGDEIEISSYRSRWHFLGRRGPMLI
jgi:hypothetical protein